MRLPRDARSVDELDGGYAPSAIGLRSDVIATIKRAVPAADFSDPSWGLIETEHASIEVNLGDDEIVESFALHIRGGGEEVLALIANVLDAVDVRAIDGSTGEFFDANESHQSWADWQRYRDQVIGEDPQSQ